MEENIIQIKNEIMINVDASVKNIIYVKKITFGILVNGKYLASFIDGDSVIMCDEIVEETKAILTNINEKSSL